MSKELAADPALAGARLWREGGLWHIDVRGLPPPEPLVAALALIAHPQVGDAVVFHHDREPELLYPELAERGWAAARLEGEAGEVRLRLFREAS